MSLYPFVKSNAIPFLICQECQYCVLGSEASAHLTKQHSRKPRSTKAVIALIEADTSLIQSREQLLQWESPDPSSLAIPFLFPPSHDGLLCDNCDYVVRTLSKMQEHCRKEHGWTNPRPKGGNTRSQSQKTPSFPWQGNIYCQRIRQAGPRSHWFQVEAAKPATNPSFLQQQKDSYLVLSQSIKAQETDQLVLPLHAKVDINPWLKRAGWATHLTGYSPSEWLIYATAPIDEDPYLQTLDQSLMRVLQNARESATEAYIGHNSMWELNRTTTTDAKPKTPFEPRMEPNTWIRYSGYWRKIIHIIYRFQLTTYANNNSPFQIEPLYTFSAHQSATWSRLHTAIATNTIQQDTHTEESLDQQVHLFLLSLLNHALLSSIYSSPLLSALAIMGLRQDGTWMSALDYTTILSGVIKVARMVVALDAYNAYIQANDLFCTKESDNSSTNHPPSVWSFLRSRMLQFMVRVGAQDDAYPTPMDWILDLRTYGRKIRSTTPAIGSIHWQGDLLFYQHLRISLPAIGESCHQAIAEAETLLCQVAYTSTVANLPSIPWNEIHDDHSNEQIGYNFLADTRNQGWVSKQEAFVYTQIQQSTVYSTSWFDNTASCDLMQGLRRPQVRVFLNTLKQLREQLWLLMHLTSGQPARATEIMGIRTVNTMNGSIRNTFIHQGALMWVTLYHKGYNISGKGKVIYRFLPRPVGQLLIWYLWLILPFARVVIKQIDPDACLPSPLLWAENIMERLTSEKSSTTDQKTLSRRMWTTDRGSRILSQFSSQRLGNAITIQSWRQVAVAIANRYLIGTTFAKDVQDISATGEFESDDEDNIDVDGGLSSADVAIVQQAGHGLHHASMMYARLWQEASFGTQTQLQQYRAASTRWQALLGFFTSRNDPTSLQPHPAQPEHWIQEKTQQKERRNHRLLTANWPKTLLLLTGTSSTLQPFQKTVLYANKSPRIVCIAGTGSGKSILFHLPALINPDGTTIVISPLVALQDDMATRCSRLGISSSIWRGSGCQIATVVFVTPESAVTVKFGEFVNRLISRYQLDRVVFDECHTVLESTSQFRPQIRQLGRTISQWEVPELYLTATLPPTATASFLQILQLPKDSILWVRISTSRHNIRYAVKQLKSTGKDQSQQYIASIQTQLQLWRNRGSKGRVIIYASTIEVVNELGNTLQCLVFHSKCGSHEEKRRRIQLWRQAEDDDGKVIVATSALGLGIDVPDVYLVIYLSMPSSLTAFVQESGRAGRDGNAALSVVLISSTTSSSHSTQQDRPIGSSSSFISPTRYSASEYTTTAKCRRLILDASMDGVERQTGCVGKDELCDNCVAAVEAFEAEVLVQESNETLQSTLNSLDWPATIAQRAAFHGRQVQEQTNRLEFQQAREFELLLPTWDDFCFLCWKPTHTFANCNEQGPLRATFLDLRNRLRTGLFKAKKLEMFSCCFFCGLPQSLCTRWEKSDQDSTTFQSVRGCSNAFLLCEVWAGCHLHQPRSKFCEQFFMSLLKEASSDDLWGFLGTRCQWGYLDTNHLCKYLFLLWKECYT